MKKWFLFLLLGMVIPLVGVSARAQDEQTPGADSQNSASTVGCPNAEADGICPDTDAEQSSGSDFADVWITFTIADDNLRHNDSFTPAMGINDRRPEADNKTDITDTHLVLYKALEGFLPGLVTEAGLVLRFSVVQKQTGAVSYLIRDDGTFVGLRYKFTDDGASFIDLTGFPFNAERFLLGYTYELTWGGKNSWPQNTSPVPGVRLSGKGTFGDFSFYMFAGLKTHEQTNRDELDSSSGASSGSIRMTYAGLFGAGAEYRLPSIAGMPTKVALDVSGGVIDKGDNPQINELDLEKAGKSTSDDDILAKGVSARLAFTMGEKIGDPLDMRLYRRDPRNLFVVPGSGSYEGYWAFMIAADMTYMRENLRKFSSVSSDEAKLATADFDALGFAINMKARIWRDFRIHLTYIMRNLEFLLFDGPHGDPPFYAFPDKSSLDDPNTPYQDTEVQTNPEHRVRLNLDYRFAGSYLPSFISEHFMVGLGVEFQMPAYKVLIKRDASGHEYKYYTVYKERESSSSSSYLTRQIRAELPRGVEPAPIISYKLSLRYEFSKILAAMIELGYMEDTNMFKYVQGPNGDLFKVYEDDDITYPVSLAFILQARF